MNQLAKKEICEIPEAFYRAGQGPLPGALIRALRAGRFHYGVWLARGSSKNAAMWMSKILWKRSGFGLFHLPFSEAAFRGFPGSLKGALCVAISQSGSTREVLHGIRDCRRLGAQTYGLSNVPSSPLSKACDYATVIGAGEEEGFATKSFAATLVQSWKFAEAVCSGNFEAVRKAGLERLAGTILATNPFARLCEFLERARTVVVLGRGLLSPIACEMATKLKECCVLPSWAMSSEEFLHGAAGLARKKNNAFLFLLDRDENFRDEIRTLRYLAARRADFLVLAPRLPDPGFGKKRICCLPESLRGPVAGLGIITAFYRALLDLSASAGINLDNESFIRSVSPASYRREIPSLA